MTQIFLDDEREPVNSLDWVIVRDYSEFVAAVLDIRADLDYISFDHDLGEDSLTGLDCAKYLVDFDMTDKGRIIGPQFSWYVHSQNPVGKENIISYLTSYMVFKFGDKYV